MKKYHRITTFLWLFLTVLAMAVAMWNYIHVGWHNSWWYFVTALFSFFLFILRFRQWKKGGSK